MGKVQIVLTVIVSLTLVLFSIYTIIGTTAKSMDIRNLFHTKENLTMKNRTKQTAGTIPSPMIIQYGMPRTATTLQFNILCAIVSLQHISELKNVGCFYNPKNIKKLPKYSVIKTHRVQNFVDVVPPGTWVVTTEDSASKRNLTSEIKSMCPNITVPLSIDFADVKKLGASIVYKYKSIFGVSDDNINHIVNYIKLWQILRVCCGRQLSGKWRAFLFKKTYALSSLSPCLMYNISEIEKRFINSYMFKLFSDKPLIRSAITKPSLVDGTLNGSYCETCNKNISLGKIIPFKRCV